MKERKLLTRRILSVVLALTMALSLCGNLAVLAEREYAADVSVMGKTVDFKNAPYSEYGTVFVPLEELCGYIGIAVSKDGDMYTLSRAGVNVQLQEGNMYAKVDTVRKDLAFSPALRSDVLYVPIEFFSLCFDIPVSVGADSRSADIKPNVYTIRIDEQHAAAVSAQNPDVDVLSLTATGADILRDHMDLYPHKSSYVYYMANLDMFKGKKIESAALIMTVKRNEVGPSITAVRTAPWTKGEINWNNQPVLKEEKSPAFATSASGNVSASLNITSLVSAAMSEGTDLSIKILGKHRAGEKNEKDKHPYTVLGVNSATPPTIRISVEETYNFPGKEAMQENTEDENRYSEFELLRSLGVFTENDEFPLDLNEGVMRYEFIRYVLRLTNTQISTGATQHFTDVPSDAPFYDEVNTARDLGFILGDTTASFRPYDYITMGEAITVLGRVLGYDTYAEERGGFTPGYFDAARIGKLYLGGASEKTVLSFNEMFKLLRNSLDASVLEIVSYKSDGSGEYTFNENKNILTEFWNAKPIEGTVTANEYSNITPGAGGKEDTIVINSKELKLHYEEYNNLLGYKVKGYYDDDDNLLYIGSKEYDVTEVSLADIDGIGETSSNVTFTYIKENGKRADDSFLKSAVVIYNGKSIASSDVTAALLQADGGSIKLVGNGLVVINAYRTVIVSAVDTENEVIYDKYDMYNRVLHLTDSDYSFKTADGEKADLANINVNDVISVMQSADGKLISGIISKERVQGTIEMTENITNLSDAVVTVNSKEYTLANITKPNLTENEKYWTDFIKMGTKATFMIDCFGSIVSVLETQTEGVPGYIVDMDYSGRSALSKDLQAAVIVKDYENYQLFDIASNVKINGTKKESSADVLGMFLDDNDEFVETAVLFDLNADGKISAIDIFVDKEDLQGTSAEEDMLVRRYQTPEGTSPDGGELSYKNGTGKLGDLYFWKPAEALTVVIPDDAEGYEDYVSYQKAWANDASPRADVYTKGTNTPEATIVVVREKKPGSTVSSSTPLVVVDRLVKAYDADGYEVDKLYYYEAPGKIASALLVNPDEVYYYESYDAEYGSAATEDMKHFVSDLERGDIVRVAKNEAGELGGIQKYYDYGDKRINNRINAYPRSRFNKSPRIFGGYSAKVSGNYLCLTPHNNPASNEETDFRWIDTSLIKTILRYEVNSAGVEVFPATINDIRTYENIPYNPTGFLYHTVYESPRGNSFIIEMPQPEGTGLYTVTYTSGANDDSVSGMPVASAVRYNVGDSITLPAAPSRIDNDFTGWLIEGSVYSPGETYVITGNTTVTAQWIYNPTFEFNFVDEEGAVAPIVRNWALTDTDGNSVERTLPLASEFEKEGYKLIGWKIGNETYLPGAAYTPETQGATFTAVWMTAWNGNASENAPEIVEGVYQITTAEELAWFSDFVDADAANAGANAKLVNNIYLNNFADCGDGEQIDTTLEDWFADSDNVANAKNWYSYAIGRTNAYQGTFDGNGKTIYGLYTTGTSNDIGGLFFNITGGTVKNLTVKGAYVVSAVSSNAYNTGRASVIANIVNGGTIDSVTAYGKITVAANSSANLAGVIAVEVQNGASITSNKSYVNIDLGGGKTTYTTGTSNPLGVGGIVGAVKTGSGIVIKGNTNYGDIYAPYSQTAGGIVAWANADAPFDKPNFTGNTNYGDIVAGSYAGQIIGGRKGASASANTAFQALIAQNTASGSEAVYTPAQ